MIKTKGARKEILTPTYRDQTDGKDRHYRMVNDFCKFDVVDEGIVVFFRELEDRYIREEKCGQRDTARYTN